MNHTVGVADMKVSADQRDKLVTHALGSCLGIVVYDPVVHVGGMLHVMLPLSTIDLEKAKTNPYVFVDTGVPRLFIDCYKLGAQKQRVIVKVAGGASLHSDSDDSDYFQIGKRNFIMLRKLLWKNNVMINSHDVGGAESRTMSLDIGSGVVTVKSNGNVKEI